MSYKFMISWFETEMFGTNVEIVESRVEFSSKFKSLCVRWVLFCFRVENDTNLQKYVDGLKCD